jgi:hypothetical protein
VSGLIVVLMSVTVVVLRVILNPCVAAATLAVVSSKLQLLYVRARTVRYTGQELIYSILLRIPY